MAWYNSSWLNRKKITVDNTKVSATLTDYLAEISLVDSDITGDSRSDGNDILFTQSDGSTKIPHVLEPQSYLSSCAWSWFSRPRSVYYNNTHEKTYYGYVSDDGSVEVGEYNHKTGETSTTVLHAALHIDDHANPSFVIRPSDHKLVAFYTKHGGTTLYMRVATNAEDSTAWETEVNVYTGSNITYAQPHILTGDSNRCVVLFREQPHWCWISTTNYSTWSSATDFIQESTTDWRPYILSATNGASRIDILSSSDHPGRASTLRNAGIYHHYLTFSSGTASYFKSDGTAITAGLPNDEVDFTEIIDGTVTNSWIWDIRIDGSGYPHILTSGIEVATDHRYNYSYWTGSAWQTPAEITDGGASIYPSVELCYSGGITFGVDETTVYLSKEVTTDHFEIQKWDNSAGWSLTESITSGSQLDCENFRPEVPNGQPANKRMEVLWCSGTYISFTSFNDVCIRCDPPLYKKAHVKIPSLLGSSDTEIYVYYNNSGATDQQDATNTFTDYDAFYTCEMGPGQSGLTDLVGSYDAALNAKTGYLNTYNDTIRSNGLAVTNGTTTKLTMASGFTIHGATAKAFEALVEWDSSYSQRQAIFSNWGGSTQAGILWRIDTSGEVQTYAKVQTDTQIGGVTGATLSNGVLTHVAMEFDTTSLRAYKDGVVGTTTYSTGAAIDSTAGNDMGIGYTPHNSVETFAGQVYRLAIRSANPGADWWATAKNNLTDLANFYTLGTEETEAAGINLVIADCTHAHTADNIALTQQNTLAVQDAAHAHSADNVVLTGVGVDLVIQDAGHAHAADNVALVQANVLTIQDSTHAHLSDNVVLTQQNTLAIADALHAHTAENLTLSLSTVLAIQDGAHVHTADNLSLTQANVLAIQEALHALSSDNVDLTQANTLIIDDALHALISDNVTLTIPSGAVTPSHRTFIIQHENRVYVVMAENRTIIH